MSETSTEKYLGKLISFVTPAPKIEGAKTDPWIGWIGMVDSVYGSVFRLVPCDYNHPHKPLCEETRWFDVRKINDIKVVPNLG